MSLPLAFGTTLDTVPAEPYLLPNAERVEFWRRNLDSHSTAPHVHAALQRPKIGLVWAGKPTHTDDRNRSMTLNDLAPLAEIDAAFFSLQKGPAAAQISTAPRGLHLIDFTQQFSDFAETAAFIAHLDLVIAVDTAVAHLAGAMGKPVYLLLPKIADWRWMIQRIDTPWYPKMRLFRQTHWRDWKEPVERIVASLRSGEEF